MQEEKDFTFLEELFEDFKTNLKSELNISENLTDKEINDMLVLIIKEYEEEFETNFTEIFLYNYYKNLLNSYNNTMNKILNFVQTKHALDNNGKEIVTKAERNDCADVLYLFGFKKNDTEMPTLTSKITGRLITVDYSVINIINNNDIFVIPPKGKPELRGPHTNYTIEYSLDYWQNFKKQITKYIQTFEKEHSEDFLDDLEDYRYWLNQYRVFNTFLSQINNEKNLNKGGKNVKN